MTRAVLIQKERYHLSSKAVVDVTIWRLPNHQPGCNHNFKYSLALAIEGKGAMRFDNEAGKGDHWHAGGKEMPYRFAGVDELISDFWTEVEKRRSQWETP